MLRYLRDPVEIECVMRAIDACFDATGIFWLWAADANGRMRYANYIAYQTLIGARPSTAG